MKHEFLLTIDLSSLQEILFFVTEKRGEDKAEEAKGMGRNGDQRERENKGKGGWEGDKGRQDSTENLYRHQTSLIQFFHTKITLMGPKSYYRR